MPSRAGAALRVRGEATNPRKRDLPPDVVLSLATGGREIVTWTEWMAVDTARLALTVASELPLGRMRKALAEVADCLRDRGILDRLVLVGRAVDGAVNDFDDPAFRHLIVHRSSAVRQWCAYAVNNPARVMSLQDRLGVTLPFAADPHMSVRECAWMAFRPFLLARLDEGLPLLVNVARSDDPRVRRFAVEVSRPRSVWGHHCSALKLRPELGRPLLEAVSLLPPDC
jgi:hypothetical protein